LCFNITQQETVSGKAVCLTEAAAKLPAAALIYVNNYCIGLASKVVQAMMLLICIRVA
jgi:hypothetical protein